MNIFDYLKDKKLLIFLTILQLAITIAAFLIFSLPILLMILLIITLIGAMTTYIILDFRKRKTFYDNFLNAINSTDNPHSAISEIKAPGFYEGNALCTTADYLKSARYSEVINLKNTYIPFIKEFESECKKDITDDYKKILFEQFSIFSRIMQKDTENNVSRTKELLFAALKSKRPELLKSGTTVSVKNIRHSIIVDQDNFNDILTLILMHAYKFQKTSIKFYCESAPEPCLAIDYSTMLEDKIPIEFILAETICRLSGMKFKMYQTDHTFVKIFYTLSDYLQDTSADTQTMLIRTL